MRACIRRDPLSSGARVEIESQGQRIVVGPADVGSAAAVQVAGVDHFRDRAPITVGAFTITPFVGEAVSREAYAVLVEADGVALLYAGELRSGVVQKLLTAPPSHVDALLMDGATVGWGMGESFPTEADFEEKFLAFFRQTAGLPLVWCSRQNVERIRTIYRACKRINRRFIVDPSTVEALSPAGDQVSATSEPDCLRMFVSARQIRKRTRKQVPPVPDVPGATRIHTHELAAAAATAVMLFRPSLMEDLDEAKCLGGSRLIFARGLGYLEYEEKANPVLEWLDRHNIPLDQFQATSHAGAMELIKLRQAFGAAPVVPIRSREPGKFDELFGGVQRRADGEWWEIASCR